MLVNPCPSGFSLFLLFFIFLFPFKCFTLISELSPSSSSIFVYMKMPGSSQKNCVACQARMAVAQKKCPSCAVLQPHKQHKKDKIKKIIEKPPSTQNAGKVLDGVIVGVSIFIILIMPVNKFQNGGPISFCYIFSLFYIDQLSIII